MLRTSQYLDSFITPGLMGCHWKGHVRTPIIMLMSLHAAEHGAHSAPPHLSLQGVWVTDTLKAAATGLPVHLRSRCMRLQPSQ